MAKVVLSTGEELVGVLHASFAEDTDKRLKARLYDLAKAYKQLPIHPDFRSVSVVAVWSVGK